MLAPMAVLVSALLGATAPFAAPPATDSPVPWRPNIVVVTLDTTRADALGCYGAPDWATPTLDAIARRGVRFEMARAPAPLTLPAHATIFTGLYPFQHGARDNGTFVLKPEVRTLAERLKEAGYATAAVPAAFVVDSSFGLDQGFDQYFDLPQREVAAGGEETSARPGEEVANVALDWLASRKPGNPFFLWVHFFDAHYPYAPPADLLTAHPLPADPKEKGASRKNGRHLYQLEMSAVDRALARVLKGLDRLGGADETLLVVVGDHGEGLGEHQEASHGALVHDATLHVPLLVANPRLRVGTTVATPVASVDITPTLLALLGLDGGGTYGADLSPLLLPTPPGAAPTPFAPTRPIYFETCGTWFTSGWAPLYGVIDGDLKIVVGPERRVFDLAHDPGEEHDVAADHEEALLRTRDRFLDFTRMTLEAARITPDPEAMARLQSLGYATSEASSRREGLAPPGWQPKHALTPEAGLANTRRFTLANQRWQQGRHDEALQLLLDLTKEEPENSHYAEIAAALLVQSARPAEALPLALRATGLAENLGNRNTLLSCWLALKRNDEALAAAQTTVDHFPRIVGPRLTLAKLLIAHGRKEEAIPHLEAFIAGYSGDAAIAAQARELLGQARVK